MRIIQVVRKALRPTKRITRDLWWYIKGEGYANPPIPDKVSNIIFICKGNICRSAYAHCLIGQNRRMDHSIKGITIDSAGLKAKDGSPSPNGAIQAAKQLSIDMQKHRAKLLSEKMAKAADMIIAMEPNQINQIKELFPYFSERVFLMAPFEPDWNKEYRGWAKYHIEDPYGKDQERFIACFQRINQCVDGLIRQLLLNNI